ncbi:M23 family metallopeptidase [Clostridium intestinale]|uniref:Metalloendopeptidase-like membrane protein n=2 Tax=Clostridium intestinale TaxID=36845 RepID=U2Q7R2_9CLOT|nr:M23 family metallopeptidase [Clostridium intestinale]ERK32204.1 metalloendopeptidase-like membrane protein [Clostridium intestinale URNW]QLY79223.1 M23 family metallopeptidase [Clostridium intestinale]
MDKKNRFEKLKNLLRKESFYVILFLCLCVVASAAAISVRKAKADLTPPVADSSDDLPININDSSGSNVIDNADQVKNTNDKSNEEKSDKNKDANKTSQNTTQKSTTVSNTNTVKFNKPLDGTLLRKYSYGIEMVKVDTNNYESIKGIDISAKVGTDVAAVAEGVVEEVGEEDGDLSGWYVVIKHTNGMKSKYANLDSNIKVKKDQKVTQGAVIGKVGNTAKKFTNKDVGEHLKFQMVDSKGEQVDPLKYFTLKTQ